MIKIIKQYNSFFSIKLVNKIKFILVIILFLVIGCDKSRKTMDIDNVFKALGQPNKIEYSKYIGEGKFGWNEIPEFTIIDKNQLKIAIEEIVTADNPEPWKGAGWDKIAVFYSDTIINIMTNGRKIGLGASGLFFELKKRNFITKHMDK
jgi:hypothetical protein